MLCKTQDPKFDIEYNEETKQAYLVNSQTGIPIPVNEPIFITRSKDILALPLVRYYKELFLNIENVYNKDNFLSTLISIEDVIKAFDNFKQSNSDLVKFPDTLPKT